MNCNYHTRTFRKPLSEFTIPQVTGSPQYRGDESLDGWVPNIGPHMMFVNNNNMQRFMRLPTAEISPVFSRHPRHRQMVQGVVGIQKVYIYIYNINSRDRRLNKIEGIRIPIYISFMSRGAWLAHRVCNPVVLDSILRHA